ncbi:MAG: hypothetical protein R6U62_01585, partial [Bacteroidales bacterium]
KAPKTWEDLLKPEFENSISLPVKRYLRLPWVYYCWLRTFCHQLKQTAKDISGCPGFITVGFAPFAIS